MKVLRYDPSLLPDNFKNDDGTAIENTFQFSLVNNNLYCEFLLVNDSNPIEKQFLLNLKDYAGLCIEVTLQQLDEKNKLVICPAFTTYSYANRLANKVIGGADKRVLRIFINETGDDCDVLLMIESTKEVPNFENVLIPFGLTYAQIMVNHSKYGKTIYDKVKKKSALLGNLDNGNSIAYLEAQVDVLTRYVLNKHMNDIDDEELRAILIAANEHSILDIKSKDKLIEEMTHKAHTRQEQLKYYGSN